MAMRLSLTLDDEHAALLTELAKRSHMQTGTLARSLLLTTLEGAAARNDEDAPDGDVLSLLASIPGARENYQRGLQERAAGHPGHSLDEI